MKVPERSVSDGSYMSGGRSRGWSRAGHTDSVTPLPPRSEQQLLAEKALGPFRAPMMVLYTCATDSVPTPLQASEGASDDLLSLQLSRLRSQLSPSSPVTPAGSKQTQGNYQNTASFKISSYLHFDNSGNSVFHHLLMESQLSEILT